MTAESVTDVTRDYYDSDDANAFYRAVWGDDDIHIGIYVSDDDDIAEAAERILGRMDAHLADLHDDPDVRVLDMGSGYGGPARHLAHAHGWRVDGVNISSVQNRIASDLSKEAGVSDRVRFHTAAFEDLPFGDDTFDVVWSQDALLHSADRERAVAEAARVLRPGGRMVFADIMQSPDADPAALQPVYDRIHLDSMATPDFYREAGARHGLQFEGFEDLSGHLATHYRRVGEEVARRREELLESCSAEYLDRMATGLDHWVEAGRRGDLMWGILRMRRD